MAAFPISVADMPELQGQTEEVNCCCVGPAKPFYVQRPAQLSVLCLVAVDSR